MKDGSHITVYSTDYGMNLNNLAGEKSDVRIQHASIASGNLALLENNNQNKKKQLLKKKKIRPHSENKSNISSINNNSEKRGNQNEEIDKKVNQKIEKSML